MFQVYNTAMVVVVEPVVRLIHCFLVSSTATVAFSPVPVSRPKDPAKTYITSPKINYSRRFATATARTASLGSHSRGMIQGRSGKWSGGVEARRALLSDGLPSHEGSPVVTMGVFNTKSWSNGRFGANIAP